MLIASDAIFKKIRERLPDYGIAQFDVARLLADVPPPDARTVVNPRKPARDTQIRFEKDYDAEEWGADHVLLINITDRLRSWLAEIAVVVHAPPELRSPIPVAPPPGAA